MEEAKYPCWFPQDPYPIKMCSIKNDKDLRIAVPEDDKISAVAWYLMGRAYRMALRDVYKALKENLEP
jgi:hypothetical protein